MNFKLHVRKLRVRLLILVLLIISAGVGFKPPPVVVEPLIEELFLPESEKILLAGYLWP